jgi:hypothetical protein
MYLVLYSNIKIPTRCTCYRVYFYLTIALHVSGIITHLQEHKTTVTTSSGNRYAVLLSVTIVEELELIWVCCGWRTPTHTLKLSVFWARPIQSTTPNSTSWWPGLILSSHLHFGLSSCFFQSGFSTSALYVLLLSSILAACLAHAFPLDWWRVRII